MFTQLHINIKDGKIQDVFRYGNVKTGKESSFYQTISQNLCLVLTNFLQ